MVPADQVDQVVDATRVFGAMIAESLASVEPPVTMPQFRVLVLAAEAPRNLTAIAEDLDVHPSNATRLCDRLVKAGLMHRERATEDRRHVVLTLTPRGRRLVEQAMGHRRDHVARAMSRMSEEQRASLASAMSVFAEAAAATHGRSDEGLG